MENSDSKPRLNKPNTNGNQSGNKPVLRKKSADGNSDGNSYNSYNDNRKPYGNRPSSPNRYNSNSGDSRYGNNSGGRNNYGNSNSQYGERKSYGNDSRYGGEKRNYDNNDSRYGGERRSYGNNDSRYGNDRRNSYGNSQGSRPYSPNRFDNKPRNTYQQEEPRYDENNKKVVFRKRKNSSEGQERKHFKPFHEEVDMTKPVRLNKFLANAGICSRREADEYIQAGVISVDGEIVSELGTKILPTSKVMFHDQPVHSERKIYLILNKPKDFVTTVEDTHDRKTVMDLVKNACSERIYPVGRLDRNTTGVLLFTNDGDLAARLTHPKYEKKKIYHVNLDKELEEADFNKILEGVELDDGTIKADDLAYVKDDNKFQVGIEIHSGKNRVVRRIFDRLGYKVLRLDRVYFAGLTKKNLPRGRYRFLTGKEISSLKMGAYE